MKCSKKTEVYSRIVGYFRPVQNWNIGKKKEFEDRKEFSVDISQNHALTVEIAHDTPERITKNNSD